jgi:hypothetical protein
MRWSKLGKAFSVGMHVLDVLDAQGIKIKGVPVSSIKTAIETALTSGKTIKQELTPPKVNP